MKPLNRSGRPKGAKGKVSKETKELVAGFTRRNLRKMDKWIEEVAQRNPYQACQIVIQLMEFTVPKPKDTGEASGVNNNVFIVDDIEVIKNENGVYQLSES